MEKRELRPGNMLNPTPVVMVSCGRDLEEFNIITIAWAGTVCSDPPMCTISIRPERHSHRIIKESGCFVINLTNERLAAITDWCGVKSGKQHHKFVETELTPIKASQVDAPMIAEAPVNIECVVKQIIPLGTHDMFLAEVVAVHADQNLFNPKNDALRLEKVNLLTYSHGHYYTLGKKIGKFGFSVQKKTK